MSSFFRTRDCTKCAQKDMKKEVNWYYQELVVSEKDKQKKIRGYDTDRTSLQK